MNKEQFKIIDLLITIIVIVIVGFMIYGIFLLVKSEIKDYTDYKEYKNFCKDKSDFCYCDMNVVLGKCSFKTQWSSVDGLSNDTIELCALANRLNDKEIIFEVGC
jgi:hypothetical protein